MLISIEMLFDKRSKRRKRIFSNDEISTAIFPLAIPLLAGPASITSVILTSQSNTKNINILITNISALFFVLLITLVILLLTVRTERFINKKVLQVFSRLIAIILSALSIQLIIDGITDFIKLNFYRIKNSINQSFGNYVVFVLDVTSKTKTTLFPND